MAWVNVDRTQITETMYSRWHSPDKKLYTRAEIAAIHDRYSRIRSRDGQAHARRFVWWHYEPIPPELPVRPLTASARRALERSLALRD